MVQLSFEAAGGWNNEINPLKATHKGSRVCSSQDHYLTSFDNCLGIFIDISKEHKLVYHLYFLIKSQPVLGTLLIHQSLSFPNLQQAAALHSMSHSFLNYAHNGGMQEGRHSGRHWLAVRRRWREGKGVQTDVWIPALGQMRLIHPPRQRQQKRNRERNGSNFY